MGHALTGDSDAQTLVDQETDPAVAAQKAPEYAHAAVRELADQQHEEAKVTAIAEAASAAVKAYDLTLPDDGLGAPTDAKQPKDIQRFDATTFTWVGGNNYTDNPTVVVQRRTADGWVGFADQSGEVQTSLKYPGNDPSALVTYRAGGQAWKWTATFEAMVNRFGLVDPAGNAYRATPAGSYRFVVHGARRSGNRNAAYKVISDTFKVEPWHGITVNDAKVDDGNHVTFSAGPSHTVTENHIRGSATPNYGAVTYTIGAVDFPDHAADQAATGVRFLDKVRGYSASNTDRLDAEHYCLMCRFRDWLDATSDLTATVTFHNGGGQDHVEEVTTHDGTFRTDRALGNGETADVVIADAWGDTSGAAVAVGS
jgi:uncharacterized protein YndB with AHSA1/START domain